MVRWMRMIPLKVMHLSLRDTLADYAKDEVDQRIHRIALLLRPEAGITHSGRRSGCVRERAAGVFERLIRSGQRPPPHTQPARIMAHAEVRV